MSSSATLLALAVFAACAVEAVEATTIVLASGVTCGWRSAIEGTLVALGVLAVLVTAVGVPLIHLVPIDTLRVIVGALLLILGLQWLRKAVLRASGHKALHDEDEIYAETVSGLRTQAGSATAVVTADQKTRSGRSATGFTVAFKGVFLEGTEVVLIVISLGASSHRLGLAALAALGAVVVVTVTGLIVARQLSEVPENTIKIVVGIMLTSFGIFWLGEGAGVHWPGSDLWILALIGMFVLLTFVLVAGMRRLARS